MRWTRSSESPGQTSRDRGKAHEPEAGDTVRRYRTTDLFGDCPWIVIEHGNAEYRLQVTRLGKLILTK